jgi:putative nucleotidyltransferase with HDIG domain
MIFLNTEHPEAFTPPPLPAVNTGFVPGDEACFELWEAYGMLEHIKAHSLLVAQVAGTIAGLARDRGWDVDVQLVRASALLHDLGKTYTVRFGGNHCQIGASWAMSLTRNPAIAQGVIHHIYWPGKIDVVRHLLPLSIIYADKRIKHDAVVSLEDRFQDLLKRYAVSFERTQLMYRSYAQVQEIERQFSQSLEVDLNAYPFDRRRVVQ